MTFTESTELRTEQIAPTTCYVHPTVETNLRCNKCDRPICARCAVRTPVGYRCKECINQQQTVFYTGVRTDYLIALAISVVLGGAIGFVLGKSLFLALILSVPAGGLISEAVHRAIGRRRARKMAYWVAAGIVVGTIVVYMPTLLYLVNYFQVVSQPDFSPLIDLAAPGLYMVAAAVVAAARFRLTI